VKFEPPASLPNLVLQQKSVICLAILLASCSHAAKPEPAPAQAVATPFPDPAPRSREANDAARFLAGLPGRPGSAFNELEQDKAWELHKAELDRMWSRTESTGLAAMRKFQANELNSDKVKKSTLFYPFSGPDALMMNVFFPENSTYVMVGLEPPGTLPTPAQFQKKKSLADQLAAERHTVNDILGKSFFITQYMDSQFRGQVTDGLFQPIIHLLVRTNHTILGYRYVRIDDAGKVVEREAATPKDAPKPANRGIEVDFSDNASGAVHRLYYFSVNIDDEHLSKDKGFTEFVPQLKGMTTYFKATSYMTHRPEFSIIRDLVLNGSSAILQDDTGLPYHFYTDPPWHVQLYGVYEKPIRPFGWLDQKDLHTAYQANNPKPLNFHIGYGMARASNLLLAMRTDVAVQASAKQ
jgi:hypothetical protein